MGEKRSPTTLHRKHRVTPILEQKTFSLVDIREMEYEIREAEKTLYRLRMKLRDNFAVKKEGE